MNPTRQSTLMKLAQSTVYGNLGIFAGAGLSMAIMNNDFLTASVALSWAELLKKCSDHFEIDYDKELCADGLSFPEKATRLCEKLCEKKEITYEEALSKLKVYISEITTWYPDRSTQEFFFNYFNKINPKWIITTNYDLTLETILTGKAVSISPDSQIIAPAGLIPVFHLHGIRTNPNSIIISQEDYVKLFRPTEYRQTKLPLLIKESTTLILGYSIGDINVQTALDWSKHVYSELASNHPHCLVQVIRAKQPKPEPYLRNGNVIIIETEDLPQFFDELIKVIEAENEVEKERKSEINNLILHFKNPEVSDINNFIDDPIFRGDIIEKVSKFNLYIVLSFLEFLQKAIDETWRRAEPDKAFNAYDENLKILMDLIIKIDFSCIPPALIGMIAFNLDRVGFYVGTTLGKSFAANNTWDRHKDEIPMDTVDELMKIAKTNYYYNIIRLFNRVHQ